MHLRLMILCDCTFPIFSCPYIISLTNIQTGLMPVPSSLTRVLCVIQYPDMRK